MDPNANIAEQMEICEAVNTILDGASEDGSLTVRERDEMVAHAARLAELVEALNGWLTRGGALPTAWAIGR